LVQENHATELNSAAFGANVTTGGPPSSDPPATHHPRGRHAYHDWLTKQITETCRRYAPRRRPRAEAAEPLVRSVQTFQSPTPAQRLPDVGGIEAIA
jgi:hypothetical protein